VVPVTKAITYSSSDRQLDDFLKAATRSYMKTYISEK